MGDHPSNEFVELWTAEDVAQRLKISEGTVKQWVKSGRLPVVKVGRLNRFRPADIAAWVDAQPEPNTPDPERTPDEQEAWDKVRAQEIAKRRAG